MTVPENIDALGMAQRNVFIAALLLLICLLFLCLVRAIKGPRVSDRIVAVNMMGTMVMVIIAIMALLLHEGYLVDICLIYAMISFLAVIVLTKVYMGVYRQRKLQETQAEAAGTEKAQADAASVISDRKAGPVGNAGKGGNGNA